MTNEAAGLPTEFDAALDDFLVFEFGDKANIEGRVTQRANLTAGSFGNVKEARKIGTRATFKAFSDIGHDRNGSSLNLVFNCEIA